MWGFPRPDGPSLLRRGDGCKNSLVVAFSWTSSTSNAPAIPCTPWPWYWRCNGYFVDVQAPIAYCVDRTALTPTDMVSCFCLFIKKTTTTHTHTHTVRQHTHTIIFIFKKLTAARDGPNNKTSPKDFNHPQGGNPNSHKCFRHAGFYRNGMEKKRERTREKQHKTKHTHYTRRKNSAKREREDERDTTNGIHQHYKKKRTWWRGRKILELCSPITEIENGEQQKQKKKDREREREREQIIKKKKKPMHSTPIWFFPCVLFLVLGVVCVCVRVSSSGNQPNFSRVPVSHTLSMNWYWPSRSIRNSMVGTVFEV